MQKSIKELIASGCAGTDPGFVCAVLKRIPRHAIAEALRAYHDDVKAGVVKEESKDTVEDATKATADAQKVVEKEAIDEAKATAKADADAVKAAEEKAKEAVEAEKAEAKSEAKEAKDTKPVVKK